VAARSLAGKPQRLSNNRRLAKAAITLRAMIGNKHCTVLSRTRLCIKPSPAWA